MSRAIRVALGVAALAACISLAACTTAAPRAASSPRAATVPAAAPAVYSVPASEHGDLARIVYTPTTGLIGTQVTVPALVGYDSVLGCESRGSKTLGYEVSDSHGLISSGTIHCDGNNYRNTAIVPGGKADDVSIRFTSNLSGVTSAYFLLRPASDA